MLRYPSHLSRELQSGTRVSAVRKPFVTPQYIPTSPSPILTTVLHVQVKCPTSDNPHPFPNPAPRTLSHSSLLCFTFFKPSETFTLINGLEEFKHSPSRTESNKQHLGDPQHFEVV